jgi:hypothetical protein
VEKPSSKAKPTPAKSKEQPKPTKAARKPAAAPAPEEPATMTAGASSSDHAEIHCAFERNMEKVDGFSVVDNQGYRFGVKAGGRTGIFYNKKIATIPNKREIPEAARIDCIWYARLKAMELALQWFPNAKKVAICDQWGPSKTTNRNALATRYAWVLNNHATQKGIEVEFRQIERSANTAREVASTVNGTQFYTDVAKAGRASQREAQPIEHAEEQAAAAPTAQMRDFAAFLTSTLSKDPTISLADALKQMAEAPAQESQKV